MWAACNGPQALAAALSTHPTTENAVRLGSWYGAQKQFGCAVDVFQKARKRDPDAEQLYYLEGLAYFSWHHTEDAAPLLKRAAQLNAQDIQPHLLLGILYSQSERLAEAAEQWKAALHIDPESVPALEGFSDDLLRQQQYVPALLLLRAHAKNEKLAINLSKALGKLNYLDDAHKVLSEALQKDSASVALRSALAIVLVQKHQYDDARKLLEEVAAKQPEDADAQLQLLSVLVLSRHANEALPLVKKVLALRPGDAEVLYLSGVVEYTTGDYATAEAHLESAIGLRPDFYLSHSCLGNVLVIQHRWQAAREQLEKAIALGAREADVHFELAKALRGLGESEGATREMQSYQKLKQEESSVLVATSASAQADKDLDAGNLKEAILHYREAIEAQPQYAGYRYKLAVALEKQGDRDAELEALRQTVALDAGIAGAQKQLAWILSERGDRAGAIEHLKLAAQDAPLWGELWINLAAELAMDGQMDEARKAAAHALEIDPDDANAKELNAQLAHIPAGSQNHQEK